MDKVVIMCAARFTTQSPVGYRMLLDNAGRNSIVSQAIAPVTSMVYESTGNLSINVIHAIF